MSTDMRNVMGLFPAPPYAPPTPFVRCPREGDHMPSNRTRGILNVMWYESE